MELNCEVTVSPLYQFNNLRCQEENYQNKLCSLNALRGRSTKLETNDNNKLFDLLSIIMRENIHHLEMFKAKHFPVSYDCRAENAIKIFFGWSVGVNIKELSEYLDISEEVTKHIYLLSTLYAKRYIKSHIEEWRIGGPGIVVLLDVYPGGCNKFNYVTRQNQNCVLCIAEVKDIPPRFWFQILNQTDSNQRNREIFGAIFAIVRPGSILVIDLDSTAITEASYNNLRKNYKTGSKKDPGLAVLVRLSQDSSGSTILTPGLAWTLGQRERPYARTPHLKPSAESDLQAAGLQEFATLPVEIYIS
ncbi:hypothetical protein QE152_g12964 [Popillia japonica]|uniref:Uncharacterized protein n=1 Tax=Popillia japonica TaxID=7064 RepID=A0AAW1LER4_POPJA